MNGGRSIMSDTPPRSGWRSDSLDCATGGNWRTNGGRPRQFRHVSSVRVNLQLLVVGCLFKIEQF